MEDIYLLDLIGGISNALDCVNPLVNGHHRRVGLAAFRIADAMGYPQDDATDALIAGLLHDIGAYAIPLKIDGLDFDADHNRHAITGSLLLQGHPMIGRAAEMVRHHHTPWYAMPRVTGRYEQDTLVLANIINLADRVDILSNMGNRSYGRETIRQALWKARGTVYENQSMEAFMDISDQPGFWEALKQTGTVRDILGHRIEERRIPFKQLLGFSRFFATIIDFRSTHTATHSIGVAETATQLAKLLGMSERDQQRMRLAGNLHDIGKLAVPTLLLDKPAKLDCDEFETIKSHATVCEEILGSIPGLEEVATWACQHHERINGQGYPHGLSEADLPQGSRIMAVADVFTAITEDRPYRDGMSSNKVQQTMQKMADLDHLDGHLVNLLMDHFEQINAVRVMSQSRAHSDFMKFRKKESSYFTPA